MSQLAAARPQCLGWPVKAGKDQASDVRPASSMPEISALHQSRVEWAKWQGPCFYLGIKVGASTSILGHPIDGLI